jgi:hypothetical protein
VAHKFCHWQWGTLAGSDLMIMMPVSRDYYIIGDRDSGTGPGPECTAAPGPGPPGRAAPEPIRTSSSEGIMA